MSLEYKSTPIGALPNEWKVLQLDEIGEFKNGINKGKEDFGHGFPMVNLNDVFGVSTIYNTNLGLVNSTINERESYSLIKGDVLFIRSSVKPSGVGLTATISCDMRDTVYSGFIIRFRDNGVLDLGYKRHCFYEKGFRDRLLAKSTVSANTNINQNALNTLLLAVPPLQEQQKIAEILSTVDAKIDIIDQQITQTQELKKGLMQRLLTKGIGHTEFKDSPLGKIPKSWEVVKQSEVATFFNGRAYKLTEWEKEGIPVIRLQNLTGTGKTYYYSNLKLPDHQYCHNGDLLYMWSATFGPVKWFGDKAIYHYHIWKIEHDLNRLDSGFHYYLLDDVTARMKNESHGSTMLHVTKGGMEKLLIKLPSLKEQQKIADILSSVDEKLEVLLEKKVHYQVLKQGLMQQLLTGKIRVKV
ncbi:restriction endonuclease subunit S [Flavobacterium sp. ACAM 123]|uniref:restriction endonuclease subunit S n=1 Tax=Flavobacterium sp. ACAM 123 TaxID=1189620 RepID=UPI000307766D|nr:restriction endonuclease subunit S [Flavobacterium sp. ACAM 123]